MVTQNYDRFQSNYIISVCYSYRADYPLNTQAATGVSRDPTSLLSRSMFTAAEDDLLLRGVIILSNSSTCSSENMWVQLKEKFLPSKDPQLLEYRYQTLINGTSADGEKFRRYVDLKRERKRNIRNWSIDEDIDLLKGFQLFGSDKWHMINLYFLPHRPKKELRNRWSYLLKEWARQLSDDKKPPVLKNGTFSPHVSDFLLSLRTRGSQAELLEPPLDVVAHSTEQANFNTANNVSRMKIDQAPPQSLTSEHSDGHLHSANSFASHLLSFRGTPMVQAAYGRSNSLISQGLMNASAPASTNTREAIVDGDADEDVLDDNSDGSADSSDNEALQAIGKKTESTFHKIGATSNVVCDPRTNWKLKSELLQKKSSSKIVPNEPHFAAAAQRKSNLTNIASPRNDPAPTESPFNGACALSPPPDQSLIQFADHSFGDCNFLNNTVFGPDVFATRQIGNSTAFAGSVSPIRSPGGRLRTLVRKRSGLGVFEAIPGDSGVLESDKDLMSPRQSFLSRKIQKRDQNNLAVTNTGHSSGHISNSVPILVEDMHPTHPGRVVAQSDAFSASIVSPKSGLRQRQKDSNLGEISSVQIMSNSGGQMPSQITSSLFAQVKQSIVNKLDPQMKNRENSSKL
jgi:hypothetical protein